VIDPVEKKTFRATLWVVLGALALGACGEDDMAGGAALGGDGGGVGGTAGGSSAGTGGTLGIPNGGTSNTGTSGAATGGSGGTPPEPEREIESAFRAPVATDRFVWTANPESGNVAVIDATTHAVRLAKAGFRPTTVAGLPGADDEDGAIVLNEGSADATVLHVDAEGSLSSDTLETHMGANAIAVSPSGRFAIAWTDATKFPSAMLDPTDSFQAVTVLSLGEEPSSTMLSVGYRPSQIVFDDAEERVLVVTEPGLSVIELGDDSRVSALVELSEDPVEVPAARDVSITPDGAIALVRLDGSTKLGVVEIETGERDELELGDFVTDLDLSADGATAFAVIGSAEATVSTLVVIPVPVGSTDASTFRRLDVPSVVSRSVSMSPDGSLALLYSNAEPNPYVAVLTSDDDWEHHRARALDLKAPVRAVFAAPQGPHGIAFQDTQPTSTKRGAFSLISTEENRAPKIVGTDAPPIAVAFSPDGANAVIATRDTTNLRYGVYLVHLDDLEETLVALPSPPLAAGIVPLANSAFVSQAHPEGRITFVNLDDGRFKTLTGFELAGRVVE
jgi:hypothetical protein